VRRRRVWAAAMLALIGIGARPSADAADATWQSVQYHPFRQVSVNCGVALLCEIELQPGERVRDGLGSLVQLWDNHLVYEGANPETPHLVVKPDRPGLRENVVITTSRRVYRLFLISTASESPTYVHFRFDEEEHERDVHLAHMRAQQWAHERAQRIAARPIPRATPVATLDQACASRPQPVFRTDIEPAQFHPRHVCQSTDHTFIGLPESATQPTDLPVPLAVTADGDRPVNYRYDAASRVFVIDGAAPEYALVAMEGRRAVRVRVQRVDVEVKK
jgi:hypothetical protein